jgi:hypothetical protein
VDWLDYYQDQNSKSEKKEEESIESDIPWRQKTCIHSWKPITLLTSVVYDCSKCEIKKEVYEDWQNKRYSK